MIYDCPYCKEIANRITGPVRGRFGVICPKCQKEFVVYGKVHFNGITESVDTWKLDELDQLLEMPDKIVPAKDKDVIRKCYETYLNERFLFDQLIR